MRNHRYQLAAAAAVAIAVGLAIFRPTLVLVVVLVFAVGSLLVTSFVQARHERRRAAAGRPRPAEKPDAPGGDARFDLEGELRDEASRRRSGSKRHS